MFDEPFHDPAEDHRASELPVYPHDDFRELLWKTIMAGGDPVVVWARVMKLLAEITDGEGRNYDAERGLVEMLRRQSDSPTPKLDAHCLLIILNKNALSETAIGKLLGVTKAAVSKRKIELQTRHKIEPRNNRSKTARAKFSRITKARGNKRKGNLWTQPSQRLVPLQPK